jgi:hypothetical protein
LFFRQRKSKMCLVLILVDFFLRYPQWDKMTVFCIVLLIFHFCIVSSSGLHQVLGRSW